jgi:eukaryotic-like serine/threonine-protein kinase
MSGDGDQRAEGQPLGPSDTALSPTVAPPSGATSVRAFAPGCLVGGRYRVVRFIARGGMGEVYEVQDEALGERVALKTLIGTGTDPEARERFKREILLARRVTHANVCRIFEFGVHRGDAGADVPFLTMELLAGESLADRIKRDGKLAPEAALPIARQLVDALAAAHAAGVVHRDFKSPNVMLVASATGPRAAVTDFGLARTLSADGPTATALGLIVGTPAYMAPEQASGKPTGHLADVYALGVVLFEMVTGRLPFEGGSALEVASLRLTRPPPSPRSFVSDLPEAWERAILRCLEREPAARFQDVREVASALEGGRPGPGRAPTRRRGRLAVALALVALALASALAVPTLLRSRTAVAPRRIVIMELRGPPGAEWAAVAVREALAAALEANPGVRLVPLADVGTMRLDLGLPLTDRFFVESTRQIQRFCGAEHAVVGALTESGDGHRRILALALQATATGEVDPLPVVEAPAKDLADLSARAAVEVRKGLGLRAAADESAQAHLALPSTPSAVRTYAQGLAAWWRRDLPEAQREIERALREEPGFAAGRATLLGLQGPGRTRTAAEPIPALGQVPSARRRLAAIRFARASDDAATAERLAREAFEAQPGLEPGLELASALFKQGRQAEGLATFDRLHRLPAPEGVDPRIDLAECSRWFDGSESTDAERTLGACRRAQASAKAVGARRWAAQAQLNEAFLLGGRGEFLQAQTVLDGARVVLVEVGAKDDLSRCLIQQASVQRQLGRGKQADALTGDYVELAEIPLDRGWAYYTAVLIATELGDLDEAERRLAKGKAEFDRLALEGRDRSVAAEREAEVLAARGRLDDASRRFADASTRLNASWAANRDRKHGLVLLSMGDLEGARAKLEASKAALEQSRSRADLVRARVALARLQLEQGREGEARQVLRLAAEEAQKMGMLAVLAEARIVEARLALARGNAEEARRASAEEQELSQHHDFLPVQLEGLAVLAQVLLRLGDLKGARQAASRVVEAATRVGLAEMTLEGRLALAQVDASSGSGAPGRASAAEVQRDADRQGYRLIATRAGQVATGPR